MHDQTDDDKTIGYALDHTQSFLSIRDLPEGTDRSMLIATIDNTITIVLSELVNHERGAIPQDLLGRVRSALNFLEQCLQFHDQEFTSFAKKRAHELQAALNNTLERITKKQTAKPVLQTPKVHPQINDSQKSTKEPSSLSSTDVPYEDHLADYEAGIFSFEREEQIMVEFVHEKYSNRLSFLRGDTYRAIDSKPVLIKGIREDGVPPIFLLSEKFDPALRDAIETVLQEKRDLLCRRVYLHTKTTDSDAQVRQLYEASFDKDIIQVVNIAFDDWSDEVVKQGFAGLPAEKRVIGAKKETESIGSSLKKVFSFSDGSKTTTKKKKKEKPEPDSNAVRTYKEWQNGEKQGLFNLSQHFSFSLLSYVMQMNHKEFDTELNCLYQIVEQQEEPDVGPVISNLSRLYKFYDNIFFDLVILTLFQRANKFDINMLQAACMSQNFNAERLPLSMDELRRRPMAHAKYVIQTLKEKKEPAIVSRAIEEYFHVHQTAHSSKIGKRIEASENLFKRQVDLLDEPSSKVIEEMLFIMREINNLKVKQDESGTFMGEEIQEMINEGIRRAVSAIN